MEERDRQLQLNNIMGERDHQLQLIEKGRGDHQLQLIWKGERAETSSRSLLKEDCWILWDWGQH